MKSCNSESVAAMNGFIQESADAIRLLTAGLQNHDPETIVAAQERLGIRRTDEIVFAQVNMMMDKGWSFFNEDNTPSSLLDHGLV